VLNERLIADVAVVDVLLMPRITSAPLALVTVRLPIRLFDTFTVTPAEIRTPLTVLAAFVPPKS
jgi:hypothetical protein